MLIRKGVMTMFGIGVTSGDLRLGLVSGLGLGLEEVFVLGLGLGSGTMQGAVGSNIGRVWMWGLLSSLA